MIILYSGLIIHELRPENQATAMCQDMAQAIMNVKSAYEKLRTAVANKAKDEQLKPLNEACTKAFKEYDEAFTPLKRSMSYYNKKIKEPSAKQKAKAKPKATAAAAP